MHHALCTAASVLIRNKSEPFGRWGSNIYCRTNKWKKATNAVGRKLGIALYSMQKLGENFSYELYEMCRAIKVIDISIEEFAELTPGFKRYVKILKKAGISSTQSLVDEYSKCTFNGINGLGKKFFVLIRDFIQNQKGYKQLHKEYERTHSNSKENTNE